MQVLLRHFVYGQYIDNIFLTVQVPPVRKEKNIRSLSLSLAHSDMRIRVCQ